MAGSILDGRGYGGDVFRIWRIYGFRLSKISENYSIAQTLT
jgi:hypothetical protein